MKLNQFHSILRDENYREYEQSTKYDIPKLLLKMQQLEYRAILGVQTCVK